MQTLLNDNLAQVKSDIIAELKARVEDKILEQNNYELLKKLIQKAENIAQAQAISALGTTYKKTGFHFDIRLENPSNDIHFLAKDSKLSFENDKNKPTHTLIIGDNYPALLNLLIAYREKIKVIYIDPPYGKDNLGEFAQTNYDNAITRDNLLSMLKPRLELAKMLLRDDGVIFCSIDDRNQAYLKCLFDDIFGERNFVFSAPRIIKKGGKSTATIQKNHDYILMYARNKEMLDDFNLDERDENLFTLEDEFVESRGKYKLTQTLDYSSLQYSTNMDYPITIGDKTFYAGGDKEKHLERLNGNHGKTDWVWRWSKSAVEWGIKNGFVVVKGNRIYTKTYFKCRKKNGDNEIEFLSGKSYTTLSFLDNENSNDNGKKDLDSILAIGNQNAPFNNPKPINLIINLLKLVSTNLAQNIDCHESANADSRNDSECDIILDFFAGSGTTAHAVMELNRADNGNRKCILVTNNEITDINPNGIAIDVTTKRLKRIMSGECYDGNKDFKWREKNAPYKDNLEVYQIAKISKYAQDSTHPLTPSAREGEQNADSLAREVDSMESPRAREGESSGNPLDLIDECAYNLPRFESIHEKAKWIAQNFQITLQEIESDSEYIKRTKGITQNPHNTNDNNPNKKGE